MTPFPRAAWEGMDLVVRTVFKTAEAGAIRLVGSIPTLSRHERKNADFTASLLCQSAHNTQTLHIRF